MAYYSQCSLSRHNPPERYPHREGNKHSSAKYCLPKSEKDVKILNEGVHAEIVIPTGR